MRLVFAVVLAWWAATWGQPAAAWAQPAPADPPSKIFERAQRLHERGDDASASIELYKVVSGLSGDSAASVGRAQLVLVESLHRMGYHGAAMGWLSRVVEAGPEHPGHVDAVRWILTLAATPGSHAASYLRSYQGELDEVAAALDEEARGELFYRLGVQLAIDGEREDARRALVRVRAGSKHGAHARLELARLELRRGAAGGAAAAAAAAAGSGDPALPTVAARAIVDSGTAAGDPAGALGALRRLEAASPYARLARSRIEVEQAGALPRLPAIPTAALEAVVIASACTRGWTANVLPLVASTARNTRETIDELLAEGGDDSAETYEAIRRFVEDSAARPGPSSLAIRLALARIERPAALVAEMERELRLVSKADPAWQTTQIATEVLQELTVVHAVAVADLGKLYRARLAAIREGLDEIERVARGAAGAVGAGPKAAAGRDLLVTEALCAASRTGDGTAPQVAAGPRATGVVSGRGCAGCASAGDPALVVGIAGWLAARRRRRRAR
jgi:hypothetical protein